MPKVLLVDHSGRGHAFAELFSRTNEDVVVYYASGCDAITTDRVVSVERVPLADVAGLVALAKEKEVDFAFIANTAALCNGYVDHFLAARIPVLGPDHQPSRLESSKTFGKEFCRRNRIPVADEWRSFDSPEQARSWVATRGHQVVVKAEGLCGGNGSFVCDDDEAAFAAIDKLMVERFFDDAGARVVIERRLTGVEFSFFVLVDDDGYQFLPMALDYPKSDDLNRGVTSGGVGALSPHPLETPRVYELAAKQVVEPVLEAIRRERLHYNGVIYIGTMLVGEQFHVLEINVRLGDPEAEAVLARVDSDFYAVCRAMLDHRVGATPLRLNAKHYCNVVATQGRTRQISNGKNKGWYAGWPYGRFGKGYPIRGVEDVDPRTAKLLLGEASLHPEKGLVTDGGRVLHVVGIGDDRGEAVRNAYAGIGRISFNGMRYRTDIGRVMPWETFEDDAVAVPGAVRSAG